MKNLEVDNKQTISPLLVCLLMIISLGFSQAKAEIDPIAQTILNKGFDKCEEAREAQVRSTNIAKRRYKQYEVYLTEAKRIAANLLEDVSPEDRQRIRDCEAVIQEIVQSEAIVFMDKATQKCEDAFANLVDKKLNRAKNSHSLYLKSKYKAIELSPTISEKYEKEIDHCDTFGDKVADFELKKVETRKQNDLTMKSWREMRESCFKLRGASSGVLSNAQLIKVQSQVKQFRNKKSKLEKSPITRRIAENNTVFGHLEYVELSEVIKNCELEISYNLGAANAKMTKSLDAIMEESRQSLRVCESAKWILKQAASEEYVVSRKADIQEFLDSSKKIKAGMPDKLIPLTRSQKKKVQAVLAKTELCHKEVTERVALAESSIAKARSDQQRKDQQQVLQQEEASAGEVTEAGSAAATSAAVPAASTTSSPASEAVPISETGVSKVSPAPAASEVSPTVATEAQTETKVDSLADSTSTAVTSAGGESTSVQQQITPASTSSNDPLQNLPESTQKKRKLRMPGLR